MRSVQAITQQDMMRYRATARRRTAKERQMQEARRLRAWETARRAAALLKNEYGASRVVLFGSLSRREPFSPHSDIDLLVWGLDERVYYQVVARLLDLDPATPIDLLRAETPNQALVEAIETSGIPL
jgi:predicted nucleotidyltransferase